MNVYLLKDVEHVGLAGQVVKVKDGFANNFLVPRKLAKVVSAKEAAFFATIAKKVDVEKAVLNSKVAMLAEKIKNMHLTIKKRVHDDDKLYGSVSADEIVDLLKDKDISINRKQVEFTKTIRTVGDHTVTIRLSSKLKPQVSLKVVGSKEEE